MAMQYLERELRATGNPLDEKLADFMAKMHNARGNDIPLPQDPQIAFSQQKAPIEGKRFPPEADRNLISSDAVASMEIDIDDEWRRQVSWYIANGYHTEIGMTEEEYIKTLPKFSPQPETFKGRFDVPLLVETRISPERQSELSGIEYNLKDQDFNNLRISDWALDPKGYKTPEVPYTTWIQDGKKNLVKSIHRVRRELAEDERGSTVYDGIALCITRPNVLKAHCIDLPGSQIEDSNDAPCLSLRTVTLEGPPGLYKSYGISLIDWGSATCGRN